MTWAARNWRISERDRPCSGFQRSPTGQRPTSRRYGCARRCSAARLGSASRSRSSTTSLGHHHIVALDDDEDGACVGCLVLGPIDANVVRMRQVAVQPDRQRQGIGRALVGFAEQSARARGHREIVAHVREPVISFYASLGYELTGPRFIEVTLPHFPMRKIIAGPAAT